MDYKPEIKSKKNITSVQGENLEKIIEQMNDCLCKVECNIGSGTGFFSLIPFPNKINRIPVLMTNNHVLQEKDIIKGKKINISMNNNKFSFYIDDSRKVYTSKYYDITIIEIKENDGFNFNKFLEIDDNIYKQNFNDYYRNRSIYVIHHPHEKPDFSVGKIKKITIDTKKIEHDCNTEDGSSGSPIIDYKTNKIVGIHKGAEEEKRNVGTFIKDPIEKFYEEYIKKKSINNVLNKKSNKSIENINNKNMGLNSNNNTDEITIKYKKNNKSNSSNFITLIELSGLNETSSDGKLFGENFVRNNKHLCKIIIGNKEYELKSYLNECDEVKKNEFKIKLKGISKVSSLAYMFCGCYSLDSIEGFSEINTKNMTTFAFLFSYCNISSIPDISKWDTRNVVAMNCMFMQCVNLKSISDISKWNTSKLKNLINIFCECHSLEYLPDISKWNTDSLEKIDGMFAECHSLKYLPDISNWKTNKFNTLRSVFYQCKSVVYFPDISKWDTSNVCDMWGLFGLCESLEVLPDISNWNTSKVKNMSKMFVGCQSLAFLPDISKWNTNNVEDISYMFTGCQNLIELPDISKWNISNVKDKTGMFQFCNNNLNIPDKFKTNIVENIVGIFKNAFKI